MAHETPTITATPRDRIGSRYAKRLRAAGRLPAIIYGHKQTPVSVSVDEKEVLTHLHHGAHVMNVTIEGGPTETCLVKELQFGFLGDNVIHVDFARVDLDEEVSVRVHLHFVGEPESAKKPGAILNHHITELEVICKVNAIPDEIRVNLAHMESVFTVGELTLPEGVRTDIDPETPVANLSFVHAEEAMGEEVEVGGEADEPEVITEARADDEDEKEKGDED